jgi:thioredoxin
MKRKWLLLLLLAVTALCSLDVGAQHRKLERTDYDGDLDTIYTVHPINQQQFRELIADWTARDWVMVSEHPVVVDFYADWCQPCKRLEPILRQVAQHYEGKVDFYRINVDENSEISDVFQIRSVPYLLICPLKGEPMNVIGVYPQREFIRVINQALGL